MNIKDSIKIRLGLTNDTDQDQLIENIIESTKLKLAMKINLSPEEVPESLSFIIIEVAIKQYNYIGSEGYKSESVEGHSITVQEDFFAEYNEMLYDYIVPKVLFLWDMINIFT